jgi:hypothetical protein
MRCYGIWKEIIMGKAIGSLVVSLAMTALLGMVGLTPALAATQVPLNANYSGVLPGSTLHIYKRPDWAMPPFSATAQIAVLWLFSALPLVEDSTSVTVKN